MVRRDHAARAGAALPRRGGGVFASHRHCGLGTGEGTDRGGVQEEGEGEEEEEEEEEREEEEEKPKCITISFSFMYFTFSYSLHLSFLPLFFSLSLSLTLSHSLTLTHSLSHYDLHVVCVFFFGLSPPFSLFPPSVFPQVTSSLAADLTAAGGYVHFQHEVTGFVSPNVSPTPRELARDKASVDVRKGVKQRKAKKRSGRERERERERERGSNRSQYERTREKLSQFVRDLISHSSPSLTFYLSPPSPSSLSLSLSLSLSSLSLAAISQGRTGSLQRPTLCHRRLRHLLRRNLC